MSTNDKDWFRKLFINEAKAAVDARKAQTSGEEKEVVATIENNVLVIKHK